MDESSPKRCAILGRIRHRLNAFRVGKWQKKQMMNARKKRQTSSYIFGFFLSSNECQPTAFKVRNRIASTAIDEERRARKMVERKSDRV